MTIHFHRDLEQLKKSILGMGALVEEATAKAITSLIERRLQLAQEVIGGDRLIDLREIQVEDECLKILALHQPVAADLRFIVAAMKVNNDLERMGDLAVNIAERVLFLANKQPIGVPLDFDEMAKTTSTMVSRCLDALVNRDANLARQVLDLDDTVDETNRRMFTILQERMHQQPQTIERAVHTLSASRNLERIADLATNIAEDVVFMVSGKIIRHGGQDSEDDPPDAFRSRPRPTSPR